MHLPELMPFALTAFTTLLVVVDPVGVVPIFVSLTHHMRDGEKRRTMLRAILTALAIALFFLLAGQALLSYLGVTIHAFAISGGVLLFLTALPMLFGQRGGMQTPEKTVNVGDDVSIFPLAVPLLSGPGMIASIMLFSAQTHRDLVLLSALVTVIILVFTLSWVVIRAGASLLRVLGDGGINIVTRVMGLILSGLAVQYVLNGLSSYLETLPH